MRRARSVKRGFYTGFIWLQLGLVAGLVALVEAPVAIGGSRLLATPSWRLVCAAYVALAIGWALRMAIRRWPEACVPLVRAARRLDRLDAPQRIYPVAITIAILLAIVWFALSMLSEDVPRAFWREPRLHFLIGERFVLYVRSVLIEAFAVLDATLILAGVVIVGRRRRQRSRRQASP